MRSRRDRPSPASGGTGEILGPATDDPPRAGRGRFSRARRAALGVCVAGLFAAEIRTIDFTDVSFRARATFRSHDLARDRIEGTDFLFDRPFGGFLDEVARRTPPVATIRLCAPASPELYDFTAAYVLAPRAVVRTGDAPYVAGYSCPGPLPPGERAGAGVLIRR